MHSKGTAKSKGKGMKLDQQTIKKFACHYEKALDMSFYIQAFMDYIGKWYKARILDCRLAKDYDIRKEKSEASYEYYIHYEPLNRRNDQWITYDRIKKTNEKIIEEDHKKKGHRKTQDKKDDKYTQHEGMDHNSLLTHLQATKFKTVQTIQMAQHRTQTWYYSPYPIHYHNGDCLYFCQFCLNFYNSEKQLKRHAAECPLSHPPGDQVYRDEQNSVAMFEVDGLKNLVYCQNLGFLSKLFLDHKNLEWDMGIFLFYVLCQIKNNQYHIAGYFSKPKQSTNNLSCILVLPFHQRKGYGKFLITFSYQLSLIQGKTGTPQKPLSDLGRQTYLSWWSQRLIDYIKIHKNQVYTLADIIKQTAMTQEDIQWTLEQCGLLKVVNQVPLLCTDQNSLNAIYKKGGRPGIRVVRQKLHWIPFKIRWQGQSIL